MKGALQILTSLSCAAIFAASASFALPASAGAQTHCNACGPHTSECQGAETYINLDGTGSTGAGMLTFSWTSDCPDADLLNPTSATPVLILYGPGHGVAADCKVYLEINDYGACGCGDKCSCIDQCETTVQVPSCNLDCEGTINGTKVVDRCGVCGGDGNSCLGCNNFDITQEQFALDSNTLALKKLVNNTNKSIKKLARTSADKNFVTKSNKEADKLYKLSWTLAWAIPSIATSCTNQVFCTSISNAGVVTNFNNTSSALNTSVKASIKRLQKVRRSKLKSDTKTVNKGDTIHAQNLTISATIPPSVSACTAP